MNEDLQEIKIMLSEEIFQNLNLVENFEKYEDSCTLTEAIYPSALQSCLHAMMAAVELLEELITEKEDNDKNISDDDDEL